MRHHYTKNGRPLLSLYVTAGYPDHDTSRTVLQALLDNPEVDMIEIGMPFSDPLADGHVIQSTSHIALKGGMTMYKYFSLVSSLNNHRNIPVLYMGYFNNVLQYGEANFVDGCSSVGIDSCIIPDLPVEIYEAQYHELFSSGDLGINCLISPYSSDISIPNAHRISHRFIYLVSSGNITGQKGFVKDQVREYLQRIESMELDKPRFVGFGIGEHKQFSMVTEFADGAIIGSALLAHLAATHFSTIALNQFIKSIRYDHSN